MDEIGKGSIPLYDFYITLKRNNFLVTPEQIADANQIIKQYSHDVKDEAELCAYLTPIFAKSEDEQIHFKQIFETFFMPRNVSGKDNRTDPLKKILVAITILLGLMSVLIFSDYLPYTWLNAKVPMVQMETVLSTSVSEGKILDVMMTPKNSSKTLSFKSKIDWGDGVTNDTLLSHSYIKQGLYQMIARIQIANNWGMVYGDTIIRKTIPICLSPVSVQIEKSFDSIEVGRTFRLLGQVTGKVPDSVSWSIPDTIAFENRTANTLVARVNREGTYNFTFKTFYDKNNAPCNTQEEIQVVVYDNSPKPDVQFSSSSNASVILLESKLHWYLFGALVIMALLSSYFAYKQHKIREQVIDDSEKTKRQYNEMIESFTRGKIGDTDVPFHNKNFLAQPEPELDDVAQNMRKRVGDTATFLHIKKTISKMVDNAGFFQPVFESRTQQIEFLVLIDKKNANDQQVKLFDFLIELLKKQNVYILKFYYDTTPLVCYNEDGKTSLEKLSSQYPGHFLLLFGDAYELIYRDYPVIDQSMLQFLDRWSFKAIMTPVAFLDWGYKEEEVLLERLPIFPVDVAGQLLLMDKLFNEEVDVLTVLQRFSSSFYEVDMVDFEDHKELYSYCEEVEWANVDSKGKKPSNVISKWVKDMGISLLPGQNVLSRTEESNQYANVLFQWIAALAVYPKLHWELTLAIGKAILEKNGLGQQLNFTTLLRLVRISWMKSGRFPDYIRLDLLKHLSKENEILARETILSMLDEIHESELNSSHYSYEEKETQKLINQFSLYAHDSIKYRAYQPAKALFEKLHSENLITDVITKSYLENPDLKWQTLINQEERKSVFRTVTLKDYLNMASKERKSESRLFFWATLATSLVFMAFIVAIITIPFLRAAGLDRFSSFEHQQAVVKNINVYYEHNSDYDSVTRNLFLRVDTIGINLLEEKPETFYAIRKFRDTFQIPVRIDGSAKAVRLDWNNAVLLDTSLVIRNDAYDISLANIESIDNDADGDGVLNFRDDCPNTVGPAENNGCPWPDGDNDGIPNREDKCPDEPGVVTNEGCPEPVPSPDETRTLNDYTVAFRHYPKQPEIAENLLGFLRNKRFKGKGELYALSANEIDIYNFIRRFHITHDRDEEKAATELKKILDSYSKEYKFTLVITGTPSPGVITVYIPIYSESGDFDGDGVPDSEDYCPDEAGSSANRGCPEIGGVDSLGIAEEVKDVTGKDIRSQSNIGQNDVDSDGDGVIDEEDRCGVVPGRTTNQGCPENPEEIIPFLNDQAENISFETGSFYLESDTNVGRALDAISEALRLFPESKFSIEVYNYGNAVKRALERLAEDRAVEIRKYLSENYRISQKQLEVVGYGIREKTAKTKGNVSERQETEIRFKLIQ